MLLVIIVNISVWQHWRTSI